MPCGLCSTRFKPFRLASISANFASSTALPANMLRNWKPIGTRIIPMAIMPNIIAGSIICCRLRARPSAAKITRMYFRTITDNQRNQFYCYSPVAVVLFTGEITSICRTCVRSKCVSLLTTLTAHGEWEDRSCGLSWWWWWSWSASLIGKEIYWLAISDS